MPYELAGLPANLVQQIDDYLTSDDYDDLARCIWLNGDGRCAEYEHRPEVCREFERGGVSCLTQRKEVGYGPL